MDLKELETFLMLARHRSFAKTATALGVGQSTVTKHIHKLEAELGLTVIDRASRPIALSEAGMALRQLAAPLVEGIRALTRTPDTAAPRRPVMIACAHGFLNELMLAAVRSFRERSPNDPVRLRLGTKPEVTEMVRRHEVDMALTPTPEQLAGLHYQPIAVSERVLITPLNHELARRELTSIADIAAHPLILLGHRTQTRTLLEGALRQAGATLQVAVEIDSMDMVKRYVELGLGVGIGHRIALDPEDERHLGIVSLSAFLPSELVGIVTSRKHRLPETARAFIAVLRERVKDTGFSRAAMMSERSADRRREDAS